MEALEGAGNCCADYLANSLDTQFLLRRRRDQIDRIWEEDVPLEEMPVRSGSEVADELAGRMLLRYVTEQHPPPADGRQVWLTPTPLGVVGAVELLHLPNQIAKRHWVLVIHPARLEQIKGPRRVIMGQGIEYYLPKGYTDEAVQAPGYGARVR
jgi:hypothetical protein